MKLLGNTLEKNNSSRRSCKSPWIAVVRRRPGLAVFTSSHERDGPNTCRIIKRLSNVNYRIQATMGRRRRLVVNFNRLKKCSSDVEAHDIRTGSKAGLTAKRLQEAAKLPLPPGNALELVDDDGNEMVVPQEIKEEEHPRQEAADPSTQAGADNVQRYPLRDRCPPDYF